MNAQRRGAVDIFLSIEKGEMERFPRGSWSGRKGRDNARQLVRFLVEERLGIEQDDIPKKLRKKHFYDRGLSGLLTRVYNSSVFGAVDDAYPKRFKRWEFRVPNNYWSGPLGRAHGLQATKWLIEEKLKIPLNEIPGLITSRTFYENGLIGMLDLFGGSPYKAVNAAYPDMFKPWEFGRVGRNYWKSKDGLRRARRATKWLVKEVLGLSVKDVPKVVTKKTFHQNGLCGMLDSIFDSSPYEAIENAFPGRFKPWEFGRTKYKFWMGKKGRERARNATKWMIEEKLGIKVDEIPHKMSTYHFEKLGLDGMLARVYHNSMFEAIDDAYPGRFKPWQFRVPNRYWSGTNGKLHGIQATKWLIETELEIEEKDIPRMVDRRAFIGHGLGGMLSHAYGGSYVRAILDSYPGRFTRKDFLREMVKKSFFYTRIGDAVEDLFKRYLTEYCEDNGIKLTFQKTLGSGRVDFLLSNGMAIDITNSGTEEGVVRKWTTRKYHESRQVRELWIVVNSSAFSSYDYERYNRISPKNVKVCHISDIFDQFGRPSRVTMLRLEAYALMNYTNRRTALDLLTQAEDRGLHHILDANRFLKITQKKLHDF